mmetsp:Transcript_857/g.1872  ORF Transcript_857/g.1872 Transcript_857/m.1872 type:complete len:100 (+) Transcript_857:1946-2245(+)
MVSDILGYLQNLVFFQYGFVKFLLHEERRVYCSSSRPHCNSEKVSDHEYVVGATSSFHVAPAVHRLFLLKSDEDFASHSYNALSVHGDFDQSRNDDCLF